MVNMYGTPCFSEPFKFFTCFIKSIKWVIELATTEDLQQHYVFWHALPHSYSWERATICWVQF